MLQSSQWVLLSAILSRSLVKHVSRKNNAQDFCCCSNLKGHHIKRGITQPLWGTVWRFLKKLEMKLPYDPAISLMGIHTKETRTERDTGIPRFITVLFTIARTWKQPRCPLADEWIRKLWYINTVEYYSAMKRNAFESVLMRQMKLEPIIQSEVSQKEKQ